jgi:hypothetical protein
MNRTTILSNCTPALPKHARAHIAAPRRRAQCQNAKHLKTQVVACFRMQYVDASELSMCLHQCITGSIAQVQCPINQTPVGQMGRVKSPARNYRKPSGLHRVNAIPKKTPLFTFTCARTLSRERVVPSTERIDIHDESV